MRSRIDQRVFAVAFVATSTLWATFTEAGQDQKPIFDSSGNLAGSFPLGEEFIEFFDIDSSDDCVGTVFHGPVGALTETIMPGLASGVAELTKVRLTVSDGQIIIFSKWRADTAACDGGFTVTDTDICAALPGGSCEEWDGGSLEPGWSVTDPDGILSQINGHLVVAGFGTPKSVEIILPGGTKCLGMQGLRLSMLPGSKPFDGEILAVPIGGGAEFAAATQTATVSGALGACFLPDSCLQTTQAICDDVSGLFQGEGSPCCASGGCIPTMSQWGLVAMGVLIITAGTLVQRRRTSLVTTA